MGGSGSTRRVVVEEGDGGGVVKISDSVVKRIRGLEDQPGGDASSYKPQASSSRPYETSSSRPEASSSRPFEASVPRPFEASVPRPYEASSPGPEAPSSGPEASASRPQASGTRPQASASASASRPEAFGSEPQASGARPEAAWRSGASPVFKPQAAAFAPEGSPLGPQASASASSQTSTSKSAQASAQSFATRTLTIGGKSQDPRTIQEVEAFYIDRLRQLEQRNSELQKITNEQFVKAVQEVEQKFLKHSCSPVCQDLQSKVYECYLGNPRQSLFCSAQVRAFSTCVERARQNALLRKG